MISKNAVPLANANVFCQISAGKRNWGAGRTILVLPALIIGVSTNGRGIVLCTAMKVMLCCSLNLLSATVPQKYNKWGCMDHFYALPSFATLLKMLDWELAVIGIRDIAVFRSPIVFRCCWCHSVVSRRCSIPTFLFIVHVCWWCVFLNDWCLFDVNILLASYPKKKKVHRNTCWNLKRTVWSGFSLSLTSFLLQGGQDGVSQAKVKPGSTPITSYHNMTDYKKNELPLSDANLFREIEVQAEASAGA